MDTTPLPSDSVETLLKKIILAGGGGGGGGASTVAELTDVTLTATANGDTLVFDSATGKWVNTPAAEPTAAGADLQEVWMHTGF